ncbi:unnamed protein product [Bursaphelenchus okinawaensis]|uniref:DUF148 domain-containing protein n=1 Tax=Bursaphelenchus okinawaensis TaxID=465554 RepID=A0A811K226_9BILA|nr:unnamed protein product [Bursaphelenchus okinawaensis]CAG9089420.1 unnamed protein product [Bursaphelenchus okinawaensis]
MQISKFFAVLAFIGVVYGQAGTLLQYIPPNVQAVLPTKLVQSLNILSWTDLSKGVSIIDSIPRFTSFSQFLQTIDINAPALSTVLNSNVNDQYTQYMQTEATLSPNAKAFVDKVKQMAKQTIQQAKQLYQSKDMTTQQNVQLTFPTMTKVASSDQFQSLIMP